MNNQEIAVAAIRETYDVLKIDSDRMEWAGDTSADGIFRNGYGFDWWPGDFKVQVRVFGNCQIIAIELGVLCSCCSHGRRLRCNSAKDYRTYL